MNDISGKVFGRLTAVEYAFTRNKRKYWKCECECGAEVLVQYYHLLNGHTKSCGCLKNKYSISNKRIFSIWSNMVDRCKSPGRKDSHCYFFKGIRVCDEWLKYEAFESWALSNGYAGNLTIDRKDSDGNYEPSNCRWITIQEQQKNKSTNLYFTHDGETKCLSEWAKVFGINRGTLDSRINKLGYSFEDAILKKKGTQKSNVFVYHNGKKYSQAEFAKVANCTPQWVCQLMKRGLSSDEIIEKTKSLRKEK